MGAISVVYKGNLHRVPDVPRQWLMPSRQISLKDFRTLLRRRSRALSRLHPDLPSSIPSPSPGPSLKGADHDNKNGSPAPADHPDTVIVEAEALNAAKEEETVADEMGSAAGVHSLPKMESASELLLVLSDDIAQPDKNELNAVVSEQQQHELTKEEDREEEEKKNQEEKEVPLNPATQTIDKKDEESDKDKRKKEVEEKLKILNDKKHNLVQVLKQIQSAEEELKRRSSAQGMAVRPSVPLQVDIPNDTGSMTRLNTPRMGSDGTLGGEMEGGENDGMPNHNSDTRHLLHMSSPSLSPSSDSQHKKPAYNVVPYPARTNLGVSSPSRFAPTGQQGQASNLPTVSVSGTNYVASSPSPAASGGTSVFRESRVPSPWN